VNNPIEITSSDPDLRDIIRKVADGERLNFSDGLALEKSPDFHAVCQLADRVRERMNGSCAGYIVNSHLDYTNICVSRCRFCGFATDPDSPDAYCVSPSDAISMVASDSDEIHIIGGINPSLPLGYFIDLISAFHTAFPMATVKAFSAVEIVALAERQKIDISSILSAMKQAGLGMLPGGGAEIFSDNVRNQICPGKATAEQWMEVHRTAHRLGIPSNSTMLYGHIESAEDRVDHLMLLRDLQNETGGFIAHIPLPYLPVRSSDSPVGRSTGLMDLRQIALARLMLDNVPHIKAYWRALGVKTAQVALRAGADDLDGTVYREKVMESAGSGAPTFLTPEQMEQIIRHAGLEPYHRDSFHKPLGVSID
jgi:aminodeoxyfutalosine synthase